MKSWNLNLKRGCGQCKGAKERKRARLDRDDQANSEQEDEDLDGENNDGQRDGRQHHSSGDDSDDYTDDEQDDDATVGSEKSKKRKRKSLQENHTHCHCPLFKVSDSLIDFMSAGQPSRKYKKDQLEKRTAAKVDRVIRVQRRKLDLIKFARDLKTEALRFKRSSRKSVEDAASSQEPQVILFAPSFNNI